MISFSKDLKIFYGKTGEPSSSVFLCLNGKDCFVFEAGNDEKQFGEAVSFILEGHYTVQGLIVSHFHQDHMKNYTKWINMFHCPFYLTKQIQKYSSLQGVLLNKPLYINEDLFLYPISTSHAKGEIILIDNKEKIIFTGDALCCKIKEKNGFYFKSQMMDFFALLDSYKDYYLMSSHEPLKDERTKYEWLMKTLKASKKDVYEVKLLEENIC